MWVSCSSINYTTIVSDTQMVRNIQAFTYSTLIRTTFTRTVSANYRNNMEVRFCMYTLWLCKIYFRSASLMILQPPTISPTLTPPQVDIVVQLLSQLPLVSIECVAMCLKSLHLPALTLSTSMWQYFPLIYLEMVSCIYYLIMLWHCSQLKKKSRT